MAVDPITGEPIPRPQPVDDWRQSAPAGLDQPAAYAPPPYPTQAYPPQYVGGPYGYPAWPTARPTNGLAIASLVMGVLWIMWLGSILALVLGLVARAQIKRTGESGDGMALAGIILGGVGVATLVLLMVAALSGFH